MSIQDHEKNKRLRETVEALPPAPSAERLRRDCDMSVGDVQCEWILPHDEGHLNCRYVKDHIGRHNTSYVTDYSHESEWRKRPSAPQLSLRKRIEALPRYNWSLKPHEYGTWIRREDILAELAKERE